MDGPLCSALADCSSRALGHKPSALRAYLARYGPLGAADKLTGDLTIRDDRRQAEVTK
jgi:hypothetical protein